jgi:hypothetical protein
MTPNDNIPGTGADANVDKVLDHNRLQLSALLDGELAPDEARFLLRRLQHDDELSGCWERWQLSGDVLRGRIDVALPSGFAARVAAAVAADDAVHAARVPDRSGGPRWLRWGGGAALAASVAVIALFLSRQAPDTVAPAAPQPARIAATSTPPVPSPAPAPTRPVAPASGVPDKTGQLASALAVADVPRRLASRRSRGQSQRAATHIAPRAAAEAPVVVVAGSANPAAAIDPFSAQHVNVNLPDRPWPRALLPGAPASGAFTVDYGNRGARPSFYPFEPRMPSSTQQQGQDDSDASATPPSP